MAEPSFRAQSRTAGSGRILELDVVRIVRRLTRRVVLVRRAGDAAAVGRRSTVPMAMAMATAATAAAGQRARLIGDRPVIDRVVGVDVACRASDERGRRGIDHHWGLAAAGRPSRGVRLRVGVRERVNGYSVGASPRWGRPMPGSTRTGYCAPARIRSRRPARSTCPFLV